MVKCCLASNMKCLDKLVHENSRKWQPLPWLQMILTHFSWKILFLQYLCLTTFYLSWKESRKPSFDRSEGRLRSKRVKRFRWRGYTRKFLEKGASCPRAAPVLPPYHQGNRDSGHRCLCAYIALATSISLHMPSLGWTLLSP